MRERLERVSFCTFTFLGRQWFALLGTAISLLALLDWFPFLVLLSVSLGILSPSSRTIPTQTLVISCCIFFYRFFTKPSGIYSIRSELKKYQKVFRTSAGSPAELKNDRLKPSLVLCSLFRGPCSGTEACDKTRGSGETTKPRIFVSHRPQTSDSRLRLADNKLPHPAFCVFYNMYNGKIRREASCRTDKQTDTHFGIDST